MSQITLVRHGQANSQARDELSYDRLSDLGQQQASWLGAHFDATGERFARAYCGTLLRQRQTAEGVGLEPVADERWNELQYFTMAELLRDQQGVALPEGREEFQVHLPRLFTAWSRDEIDAVPERFADFRARVGDALAEVSGGEGRAIVFTSGGVIGMAMAVTLQLDIAAQAKVALSIENSSLSRWLVIGGELALTQFNALPHLETPERQFARSHI